MKFDIKQHEMKHECDGMLLCGMCGNNNIFLDVNRTKEMIIDFRRNKSISNTICVMGDVMEVVEDYK